jgi:hypothetical protein
MAMDRALTLFIKIWLGFWAVVNLILIASIAWFEGWGRVQEILSPYNFLHFIEEIIFLSPALGAQLWLERRRHK